MYIVFEYKEHGPGVFKTSNKQRLYSEKFKLSVIEESILGKYSQSYLAAKYNITTGLISNWVNKWYNGIEIKGYDPKEDVYTMKPRKTTFEERLDIVKWVIANNTESKVRQESEYKTIDFFRKKGYTLAILCEILGVSRSSYYKDENRVKPAKEKQDELLCSLINEYNYGSL